MRSSVITSYMISINHRSRSDGDVTEAINNPMAVAVKPGSVPAHLYRKVDIWSKSVLGYVDVVYPPDSSSIIHSIGNYGFQICTAQILNLSVSARCILTTHMNHGYE